jgi:hypothetical protein
MLAGGILSTLGKEYDSFKDICDTISTSKRMVNLLIEKLCTIELRAENWHRSLLMKMTRSRILQT